jgi:hypothetical protein
MLAIKLAVHFIHQYSYHIEVGNSSIESLGSVVYFAFPEFVGGLGAVVEGLVDLFVEGHESVEGEVGFEVYAVGLQQDLLVLVHTLDWGSGGFEDIVH